MVAYKLLAHESNEMKLYVSHAPSLAYALSAVTYMFDHVSDGLV